MAKTFVGSRLRQLRRERNLSQAQIAQLLGLSASYVNQIEHDVRPLTVAVLRRITENFGVDETFFSRDDSSRLLAEVNDVVLDREVCPTEIDLQSISELVDTHPEIARALVDLHRRYRNVTDKFSIATEERNHPTSFPLRGTGAESMTMPHEEVRDFFYARQNYIDELDLAAEKLANQLGIDAENNTPILIDASPATLRMMRRRTDFSARHVEDVLSDYLTEHHRVNIIYSTEMGNTQHQFHPDSGLMEIDARLSPGQKAFRMAAELAYFEVGDVLTDLVASDPRFTSEDSRKLALRGLATYYAAALLLPYTSFHARAESAGYDIEYLASLYGMGYETICHRLSTLQRPTLRGIPWTFVRVDRAGNMSKRQSATGFHFTHSGGTCPLWNVYETFSYPGKVMRQLAQMPDGRLYVWVSRTVEHHHGRFGQPGKMFAIGLGCEARHAEQTVYAEGLDLSNIDIATPIGPGCRVCSREHCPQRAFPPVHRPVRINAHSSSVDPY